MPNLARLIQIGSLEPMRVSLPEISAVSWTTFMTGTDPGEHGVFGFIDLKEKSKETRFPSFRDVQAPTLWDRLGQNGKRSIVINQPATYPARPIPGILVSGFVALELRKACFPARYFPELKKRNYELDLDTRRARTDPEYLFQALNSTLDGRRQAMDLLWNEEWDYFQIVITGTDRLQHYLWQAIENRDHPLHLQSINYYQRVDELIGEITERFLKKIGRKGNSPEDFEGLFLLSDHGFTSIHWEFNLNLWLRENNYLVFPEGLPPADITLAKLPPETLAFALDPGRIYLNRTDRFQDGSVDPREITDLANRLADDLLRLTHDNRPVVREVFRREQIYHGFQAAHGPDLVVLPYPGFDVKGRLDATEVFTKTDLQGMHTWDDAFFWSARPLERESETPLNIVELAPRLESFLRLP